MYTIDFENEKIYIRNALNFDLLQTFDCGQAFRWSCNKDGVWKGLAYGKPIEIFRDGNDIVIAGATKEDFDNIWYRYFDLDRDYGAIIEAFSNDTTLSAASQYGSGIRILAQEPWEALCSFIISQNNNIPRIKGIIERLCENFGEKCGDMFTFPSAERLAPLEPEELAILRCGFRAKYIIDAARKVASEEIDLEKLKKTDADSARNELMKIKGVGPKVADCTLLFGLEHIEAFPKDVWIKRAMEELFSDGLPTCALPYAGIAQQYIFHYIRMRDRNI